MVSFDSLNNFSILFKCSIKMRENNQYSGVSVVCPRWDSKDILIKIS